MNFQLFLIWTPLSILTLKYEKRIKIALIFIFLKIKNILKVKILYKSQEYKCYLMFKIWQRDLNWEQLKVQETKLRIFKVYEGILKRVKIQKGFLKFP